ncbi:MAG: winged helix DNA-binding protein [Candidatus Nanohalobium sp.]
MTDAEDIFLHKKPARLMVHLNNPARDNYTSQIAREIDCTYSHAVRITQKLEETGLVKSRKEGRKKILELTTPGEQVAEALSELLHRFRKLE